MYNTIDAILDKDGKVEQIYGPNVKDGVQVEHREFKLPACDCRTHNINVSVDTLHYGYGVADCIINRYPNNRDKYDTDILLKCRYCSNIVHTCCSCCGQIVPPVFHLTANKVWKHSITHTVWTPTLKFGVTERTD